MNTTKKLGVAGLLIWTALAGCQREVILQGDRFPVRAPLEDSIPVEGQPAPQVPPDQPENISAPISLPAAVANAEWPQKGGSARHAGPNGKLSAAPQLMWSVKIGTGNSRGNRVEAAPVVANGAVYAMDARSTVSAISMGGGLIWQKDLTAEFDRGGNASGGGLAAMGGRIYATTGYGEVVALDAKSGAVVWRQRLDAPSDAAPAVDGKVVYVVSRDGSGTALTIDTGRILWQAPGTPSASGFYGPGAPAVGDKDVILPFSSGEIAAVGKDDGARSWGAAVAGQRIGRAYAGFGDITGDPVIAGGAIYIGTAGGRTVSIDETTGQRNWTALEGALNPPLVVGGAVFVVNDEARLVRLDAGSGEVIWSVQMPYFVKAKPKKLKAIYAHYGPVLAGGRLVVVSSDGQLRLFDPTNGNLVGGAAIPNGAASAPALAGGMLFVVGKGGQLHAFR